MKRTITRTLKIMVDAGSLSAFDLKEIEEWENEGGNPGSTARFLKSTIPIKRGEIFEVIGGDFHTEDGKLYYEAEIELLALP